MAELPKADMAPYNLLGNASPLQTMKSWADLGSSMTAAERSRTEFEAKKAAGAILQKHVAPDGTINWPNALPALASNPATAIIAPEMAKLAAEVQGIDLQNINQRIKNDMDYNVAISGEAFGLLERYGDKIEHKHVVESLLKLHQNYPKVFDSNKLAQAITDISKVPAGTPLYNVVSQIYSSKLGGVQANQTYLSRMQRTDTGGSVVTTTQQPGRPQVTLGQVGKTVSPEFAATPVDVVEQGSGRVVKIPQGAAIPPVQQPQPNLPPAAAIPPVSAETPPGAPAGNQPPSSAGVAGTPGGSVPPSSRPAPLPPASTVPITKLGPEREARLKQAADYGAVLQQDIQKAYEAKKLLVNIQEEMKKAPTGGGATFRNRLATVAQAFGVPQSEVDRIAGGDKGAQDVLKKLLFQNLVTGGARSSIGSQPSNFEWGILSESNLNLDTDPRAAEKLVKLMSQLTDAKLAEGALYDKMDVDKTRWQEFWGPYAAKRFFNMKQGEDGVWRDPEALKKK